MAGIDGRLEDGAGVPPVLFARLFTENLVGAARPN
jgi:hypothetical protein